MKMTFKIHIDTILSTPWLALPNNDSGHDLLPEIGLSFLNSGHHHIPYTSRGQAVQAALDSLHRDYVKVLSTSVIGAVHCGRNWQTQ